MSVGPADVNCLLASGLLVVETPLVFSTLTQGSFETVFDFNEADS